MATAYVQTDESGAMRVGRSGVPLDSIVAAFDQGHSPESIRSQYPSLTLEEVYGAITYCLSHPDEVSAYLKRQDALWEHWRAKAEQQRVSVVERLRELRNQVQTP